LRLICCRRQQQQQQQLQQPRLSLLRSELPFFARAKKRFTAAEWLINVTQRNTPQSSRPSLRYGSAAPTGFFDATSCRGEKRRTSMCVALRVFPAGSAAADGGPVKAAEQKKNHEQQQQQQQQQHYTILLYVGLSAR
jgi:hypothetical protein